MNVSVVRIGSFSQVNPLELGRQNRGISSQVRQDFEKIVSARSEKSNLTDKQFISSLTADQLETLREYHGLATSGLQVTKLSDEGAHNLVSAADDLRDLDGDGNISIGLANLFIFPPPGAPSEVYAAYAELSLEEQQSVYQTAAAKQAVHQIAQQDSRVSVIPGIENTQTIFNGSYEQITNDLLNFLINQRRYSTDEDYYQKFDAVSKFKEALKVAHAS